MANLPAVTISNGKIGTATATDTIVGAVGYGAAQSLTTAQQTQARANLGFSRVAGPDSAYSIPATATFVAIAAITAARTYTMPLAAAYPTNMTLLVFDENGSVSATNTVTTTVAGSDTINGAASAIISTSRGYLAFQSDGASKWTIVDQPGGSVTSSVTPLVDGSAAIGTSSQAARADHVHPTDTSRASAGALAFAFCAGITF